MMDIEQVRVGGIERSAQHIEISTRPFLRLGTSIYAFWLWCTWTGLRGGALISALRLLVNDFVDMHCERAENRRIKRWMLPCAAGLLVGYLLWKHLKSMAAFHLLSAAGMLLGMGLDSAFARGWRSPSHWLGVRTLVLCLAFIFPAILGWYPMPLLPSLLFGAALDMATAYTGRCEEGAPLPEPVKAQWPGIVSVQSRLFWALSAAVGVQTVCLCLMGASFATVALGLAVGWSFHFLILRHGQWRNWSERCHMGVGLVIWACGAAMVTYNAWTWTPGSWGIFIQCAVCATGMALAMDAALKMDARLRGALGLDTAEAVGEDARALRWGALLALLATTCILRIEENRMVHSFNPLHMLKLIQMACMALLAVVLWRTMRYPMDAYYENKLQRYAKLVSHGEREPALEEELERVLVKPSAYRWGLRLITMLVRPFFRNRLIGAEHLARAAMGETVLICNHSEVYGPIAAYMFVPFPTRIWSDNRVVDRSLVIGHIMKYSFPKIHWLPERLKLPIAKHIVAPAADWLMKSLGSIPVYRSQPNALIKTFRASITALQAGDTLLIFPENPDDPVLGKPGYVRKGVGPWFSGIGMLGQLYTRRTGRDLTFIPMYAGKHPATLSIGAPEIFRKDADPAEEAARVMDALLERSQELVRAVGDA